MFLKLNSYIIETVYLQLSLKLLYKFLEFKLFNYCLTEKTVQSIIELIGFDFICFLF